MEQAASFKAYPHIGEKVFGYLTNHGDFKICLFVCKSWNEILNNPTFWLNKLKKFNQPDEEKISIPYDSSIFWLNKLQKLPMDVLIVEDWQNLIIQLKNNDLAQKELAIGLREEYFIGLKRLNGKFWCRTCDVEFSESMNLYKHLQRKTHFLKAGLISMSEYQDHNWSRFLCQTKKTICKLCGKSYDLYMDHLRGFYHFDKGYEIST